jgi:hypothetical protein
MVLQHVTHEEDFGKANFEILMDTFKKKTEMEKKMA